MVLRRLVRAPGQAVAVAVADSAAASLANPVALVVRLWPVNGEQRATTLAMRVVPDVEASPAVGGRCCRCSTLGDDGELLELVSHGS